MISKTIVSAFAMAGMCVAYLLGAVGGGFFAGTSFKVNVGSLVIAILSKIVMSLGWASLYTFLNVIFRKFFGVSIISCFFFGTGILIIGAAAIFGNSSVLNIFLYGSSVFACLSSSIVTVIVCLVCSVAWTLVYIFAGTKLLSKCDVY